MWEPFRGIMQNLLTLCYSFSTEKETGFKSWVTRIWKREDCLKFRSVGFGREDDESAGAKEAVEKKMLFLFSSVDRETNNRFISAAGGEDKVLC
jgi:hypothetical protein